MVSATPYIQFVVLSAKQLVITIAIMAPLYTLTTPNFNAITASLSSRFGATAMPTPAATDCLLVDDRIAAIKRLEQAYCTSAGYPIKADEHYYKVSGSVVAYACNGVLFHPGSEVIYCKSNDIDTALNVTEGCTRSEALIDGGLTVGWGPIAEPFCGGSLAQCYVPSQDGCQ